MIRIQKSTVAKSLMVIIAAIGAFSIAGSYFSQDEPNTQIVEIAASTDLTTTIDSVTGDSGNTIVSGSSADFPIVQSIDELAASSPFIVVGTVKGTSGVVNTMMDTENHDLPHPDYFGIGRVYDISVTQLIKGETSVEIQLVQGEGSIKRSNPAFSLDTVADLEPNEDISPLSIGQDYLLFLREWPSNDRYYVPALEPYRFALVDGMGIAEGMMDESREALPTLAIDQLLRRVSSE